MSDPPLLSLSPWATCRAMRISPQPMPLVIVISVILALLFVPCGLSEDFSIPFSLESTKVSERHTMLFSERMLE